MMEGGWKYAKNGPAMGVMIGSDAAKSGKNTNLLLIMRVRLSQRIGLHNLTNRTRFKKGNGYKQHTKIIFDYYGISIF